MSEKSSPAGDEETAEGTAARAVADEEGDEEGAVGGTLPAGLNSLKDTAEVVGKLFLGFLGFCYAVGFIAVNVHLSEFGIHHVNFLQSNYITAGIWVLLPIIVPLAILLLGGALTPGRAAYEYWLRQIRKRRSRSSDKIVALLLAAMPLMTYLLALWWAWHDRATTFEFVGYVPGEQWRPVTLGGAWLALILFLFYIIAPRTSRQNVKAAFVPSVLSLAILLIIHIIFFGRWVYGTIPVSLGGGGSQRVELVIESKGELRRLLSENQITFRPKGVEAPGPPERAGARPAAAPPTGSGGKAREGDDDDSVEQTTGLDLITVTEDEYIVRAERTVVGIPKDVVKAVVYKDSRLFRLVSD